MTLIPLIKKSIKIPLIAAGGIGSGPAMLAAMALGADAVQVGSRFVASPEASSHDNFKKRDFKSPTRSNPSNSKGINPCTNDEKSFFSKNSDSLRKWC